jgi:hypothetical protein
MSNQSKKPDARAEKPDTQSLAVIGWSLASLTLAVACVAALLVASENQWRPVQHSALETNVEVR